VPLPFDRDGALGALLLVLLEPDEEPDEEWLLDRLPEDPSSDEPLSSEEPPSSENRWPDEVVVGVELWLPELPVELVEPLPVPLCAVVEVPPRAPMPRTAAIPSEPAAAEPTSVRRNAPARRTARSRSVICSLSLSIPLR